MAASYKSQELLCTVVVVVTQTASQVSTRWVQIGMYVFLSGSMNVMHRPQLPQHHVRRTCKSIFDLLKMSVPCVSLVSLLPDAHCRVILHLQLASDVYSGPTMWQSTIPSHALMRQTC